MKQSLFRSIRMKLLDEGKTFKYIKYAIGEILLIITGILIAVQISNWNEDRKAQVEFDEYVVQLREDVKTAIENTNDSITTTESFLELTDFVLTFLDLPENEREDLESFENGISILAAYSRPQVHVGLLGQLMDGEIDIIGRDPTLTQLALVAESGIEQRLSNMQNVTNRIDLAGQILNTIVGRGRNMGIYGRPPRYDLKKLESSEEFKNTSYSIISELGRVISNSQSIVTELESFLAVLEEYGTP